VNWGSGSDEVWWAGAFGNGLTLYVEQDEESLQLQGDEEQVIV
jgi:hypothetical protein